MNKKAYFLLLCWLVVMIFWYEFGNRILNYFSIMSEMRFEYSLKFYSALVVSFLDGILMGLLVPIISRRVTFNKPLFFTICLPLIVIVIFQIVVYHSGFVFFFWDITDSFFIRILGLVLVLTLTTNIFQSKFESNSRRN